MLRDFDIIPGRGCNFRCKYCFEAKSPSAYPNNCMSDAVIDAASLYIRRAAGICGGFRLSFYGGEPLLHPSVIQRFSENLRDFNAPFVIITNGMLLKKNADLLFALKRQRPIHIAVSYDYCLQDETRQAGSYLPVRENIIWLHSLGITPGIITTFTLGALSRLGDVFSDFLRLKHKIPSLNLVFNIDRFSHPEEYNEEAFITALKDIRSYLERTGNWGLVHPNSWTYRRERECNDSWICGAHSGIDVDGSIYPSYNIASHNEVRKKLFRFGSVFDDFAAVIAKRTQVFNETNWVLPEQCQKCENWCRENVWRSIKTSLSEASGCPGDPHCRVFGLFTKYLRP